MYLSAIGAEIEGRGGSKKIKKMKKIMVFKQTKMFSYHINKIDK